ncbi:VRR-NUC domain-containing protein [Bacillus sp. SCS-151]|uniref:VRR-NUC domain-containing protein n=1 Tax=Nanhaiella sioensis TaxID=3115293 RepID=UPI00397D9A77
MLESQLERTLKREVEKVGGQALKWTSPGKAGVPDRIVLLPGGRCVFVEMKAPGKPLRPLQKKRKRELENLGFEVYKLDSLNAIDEFIQEVAYGI